MSAKYHAVMAMTPLHKADSAACVAYHQDIIGICCNALFVAGIISSFVLPKLENAFLISGACYLAVKMQDSFVCLLIFIIIIIIIIGSSSLLFAALNRRGCMADSLSGPPKWLPSTFRIQLLRGRR